MPDVRIAVTLDGPTVEAHDLAATINDLTQALGEIEGEITRQEPKINWKWDDEAAILLAATPNGVPQPTLERIVVEVDNSFRSLREASGRDIDWPTHVRDRARSSLLRIVRRLSKVEAITVRALEGEPLTIDSVRLPDIEVGRPAYLEISALEGVVETLSVRGGQPHFTLREYTTERPIQCIFAKELLDTVKEAFGRAVTAEGTVRYKQDGVPTSMVVDSITLLRQPQWTLEELGGRLPNLTNGVSAAEYVRRIRSGDHESEP
jgi:hypothetical protein